VTGDIADRETIARLITRDTDAVFHLAAIVSGQAEADTDLGYRVNLDGTRAVLDACRAWERRPGSSLPARSRSMAEGYRLKSATTPR
jgi:nucleoside-diphosphate-sugar epimerase